MSSSKIVINGRTLADIYHDFINVIFSLSRRQSILCGKSDIFYQRSSFGFTFYIP